jgi:pre-mRNA-splicing factor CWC26
MQREFDEDADKLAQQELRPDDPMARYFAAKLPGELERAEKAGLDRVYGDTLVGESGFNVPQEVPPHSWLRRGVAAPPNRYGIKPGRHWDGVHRSNGLEKLIFACANRRAAKERDDYLNMVDL